jgi:cyclase
MNATVTKRRRPPQARVLTLLSLAATSAGAQLALDPSDALTAINSATAVQIFPVSGNVYLLADPNGGTNITVQIGDEGVLLVDSGSAENAAESLELIERLSSETIRFLINTTGLPAYTGGNEVLAAAGAGYEGATDSGLTRASGIAHENAMMEMVMNQMSADGFPDLSFYGPQQAIYFNDETVDIFYQPNANTNGETIVFFRKSDVISAGPVFLTTTYPSIYPDQGGTIDGVLSALNAIIDITNTRKNQEGGTLVVSGAGRVGDEADVVEYRDMLKIIRERIAYYMGQGMTLNEIKAARPTMDYDGRYAAESGPAEPENFVEIIYNNLLALAGDRP